MFDRTLLLLPVLLLARVSAAPVGGPESFLPADVIFAVHVRDVANFDQHLEGTILGRAWESAEAAPWREKLRVLLDENSFFDELELTNRELLEQLPGSWVVAFRLPNDGPLEPGEALPLFEMFDELEMILLAEPASASRLREIVEQADAQVLKDHPNRRIESSDYYGTLVYTDGWADEEGEVYIGSAYAITDDWWIFAEDPLTVRDLLDGMADRAASSRLSTAPGWVETAERLDGGVVTAFANISVLGKLADRALRSASNDSPITQQTGIQPAQVAQVLRLDVLGGLHLGLIKGDAELGLRGGFTWEEAVGLVTWFRSEPLAKLPSFVPPNALSANTSGYDLGHTLKQLENAVAELSPVLHGLFVARLESWQNELGLDVRAGLLSNFAVGTTSVAEPREGEGAEFLQNPVSQVIHLPLKDAEAFLTFWRRLQEAIPSMSPFWTEREFAGASVWEFRPPAQGDAAGPLSLAVAHGGLLVELQGQGLLNRLLAQTPGDRALWDDDALRPALSDLPPDVDSIGVVDLEMMGPFFNRLFRSAMAMAGDQADPAELAEAQQVVEMLRSIALPVWAVSSSQSRTGAVLFETRLVEKLP